MVSNLYHKHITRALLTAALSVMEEKNDNNQIGPDNAIYVTFNPQSDGVYMPQYLKDRYGTSMTVVIENMFHNLEVDKDGIKVVLSFGGKLEHLTIPKHSIISYVDVAEDTGLTFERVEVDFPEETPEIVQLENVVYVNKWSKK